MMISRNMSRTNMYSNQFDGLFKKLIMISINWFFNVSRIDREEEGDIERENGITPGGKREKKTSTVSSFFHFIIWFGQCILWTPAHVSSDSVYIKCVRQTDRQTDRHTHSRTRSEKYKLKHTNDSLDLFSNKLISVILNAVCYVLEKKKLFLSKSKHLSTHFRYAVWTHVRISRESSISPF